MKTVKLIIIAIGLIFLGYTMLMATITNFNFGIIACAILSLGIICLGICLHFVISHKPILIALIIIMLAATSLATFLAVYGNLKTTDYTQDAVIVLGAGIRGEQVTIPLARRLDEAIDYAKHNPNAKIVVSGAQGLQEDITEARAMQKYLTTRGVAEDSIILEEKATSTYENLNYSKQILDNVFGANNYKVVVITNDFHAYRAMILAKKIGLDAKYIGAKTEWYITPLNYLRECVAVVKTWIVGI
ncbi:MAG: YdcF family protein [Clostridiales bacterium]|jgi:uncharacterized SAM-binding protein YcdF (DUF218 family)|nr:YdcF family protein [Clostridiales bacterium]